MTELGLPPEDTRVVTLLLDLPTAERWLAAAASASFPDDLSGWLRSLADRAADLS